MAVDPNTGQTVLNIPGFDQKYAAFLDPNAIAQNAAQQNQLGMQSQLAQSLMSRGYIPNSGFGGALAQMAQAMIGMKMLQGSKDQMSDLYAKQLQAAQQAAQAPG